MFDENKQPTVVALPAIPRAPMVRLDLADKGLESVTTVVHPGGRVSVTLVGPDQTKVIVSCDLRSLIEVQYALAAASEKLTRTPGR